MLVVDCEEKWSHPGSDYVVLRQATPVGWIETGRDRESRPVRDWVWTWLRMHGRTVVRVKDWQLNCDYFLSRL